MKVIASTVAALMLFASAAAVEPLPQPFPSPYYAWWNGGKPPPVNVTTCPQFADDPYARYAIVHGTNELIFKARGYQRTGLSKDNNQELIRYFIESGAKVLKQTGVYDIEF